MYRLIYLYGVDSKRLLTKKKEATRMNDNKIIIDPDQFAAAIIAGNPKQTNEDNKVYIKRQLTLYLESVLLANDFNSLEENQFGSAKEKQRQAILEKIIEHRYH